MTRPTHVLAVAACCLAACARPAPSPDPASSSTGPSLEVVAESGRQWTGVAVTTDGRLFTNFPRWSEDVPVSVAEVLADGSLVPYPNAAWNTWSADGDPAAAWVCVQSVVTDGRGFLWVLDPANPGFAGVVPGGAKLVQIEVASGEVVRTIVFDEAVAPPASYLNDVRIDHAHRAAYITDSGLGALLVVDLAGGSSRRVLDGHPSTSAEDTILVIEGEEWRRPDGSVPEVHADGIAYDASNDVVYFQALTGRTLYRLPAAVLRDPTPAEGAIAAAVQEVAVSGPSDGLLWDGRDGVFISAIEKDAVMRWSPAGGVETVISSPLISWPDSFARGPDGALYVTTSQIHRGPDPPDPYRILRITGL